MKQGIELTISSVETYMSVLRGIQWEGDAESDNCMKEEAHEITTHCCAYVFGFNASNGD